MTLKDKFKIIISEFHQSELPPAVPRRQEIDFSILTRPVNKVVTVTGPRRAGKTYFLFQIMKKLMASGLSLKDFIYVNFEDERIAPVRTDELHLITDAYFELYDDRTDPILFLDEVQNVAGWELFVRRLNEKGTRIFITGSNSRMLGREIATELRSRTLTYEIFPFSFAEFLLAKGVAVEKNMQYGRMRHQLQAAFEAYMASGGYPEIAFVENEQTRGRIFQDYFNAVFYRDLVERYQIKSTDLLRQWLTTLIAGIASQISYGKVENDFKSRGIKVSRSTLSAFAGYAEDVYFGFFVEMYAGSVRRRQINPRKFYLADHGLHNYLSLKVSENRGRLLENIIFLELRRNGIPVFYFKSDAGHETDFLLKTGRDVSLIQVCHDLSGIGTRHREKTALLQGMKALGLNRGLILTRDETRDEETGRGRIGIRPAWEWLLESAGVL